MYKALLYIWLLFFILLWIRTLRNRDYATNIITLVNVTLVNKEPLSKP